MCCSLEVVHFGSKGEDFETRRVFVFFLGSEEKFITETK